MERCRESVLMNCPEITESDFIVIDNNPPQNNRYFTISCNEGIRQALRDARIHYIWLLNNDTDVAASVARMETGERIGLVAGKNLRMDNPDEIVWGGSLEPLPAGKHKSGLVSMGQLNTPTQERWLTFTSVLIRREVFEEVGLLDPHMRLVYSDVDFCFRARIFGWECWYEPSSVLKHRLGVSYRPRDRKIERIFNSDYVYFMSKWVNGKLYHDLSQELF